MAVRLISRLGVGVGVDVVNISKSLARDHKVNLIVAVNTDLGQEPFLLALAHADTPRGSNPETSLEDAASPLVHVSHRTLEHNSDTQLARLARSQKIATTFHSTFTKSYYRGYHFFLIYSRLHYTMECCWKTTFCPKASLIALIAFRKEPADRISFGSLWQERRHITFKWSAGRNGCQG